MKDFFYFNDRLTEKLNRIRRKPFTLVTGRRTCGKSTAVYAYLVNLRKKAIWHHLSSAQFESYLPDFLRLLFAELPELEGDVTPEQIASDPMPAHALAALMKKQETPEVRFYVLECDGEADDRIVHFLYELACQRIPQFFCIVIAGQTEAEIRSKGPSDKVNLIEETDFQFTPQDILTSYRQIGIGLFPEEAVMLYACSHGWAPMVKELATRMHTEGKEATWDKLADLKAVWLKTYEEVFAAGAKKAAPANRKAAEKADKANPEPDIGELEKTAPAWTANLWRRFLALDTDGARELLLRRKQICAKSGARDEALFIGTVWYKVFSGRAVEAYADMSHEIFARCGMGKYDGSDRLLEWSLLLRLFLREVKEEPAYEKTLERFAAAGYVGIFRIMFAGLYLMRVGDMQRLAITMEMLGGKMALEELVLQKTFLTVAHLARGEREQAAETLREALRGACKASWVLPFVYTYDHLYPLLRTLGDADAAFVARIRERVNAFRRQRRKNTDSWQSEYGAQLTQRQTEIVALVTERRSNKEIAALLHISENTVKTTLKTVYRKLGVEKRQELYALPDNITP